ncbi:serine/threonine-protein kinase [Actinomadura sp. K4S16]|uniref:serine/threonine protein kinase n=1 Tax=Actinomadura sp. K4S16 TaxID=1316147 RepID=UPI001358A9A3|nr:serine/threonine-protein kinase [Actinomadura sp. K4S16]
MPEALPLQPGDPGRLGSFEITGRLGVGEQGAVFLGRDPAGRPVAVKVLHVRLSGEPVARSRFADAFSAARKVTGFCTAAILHADMEGDRPYVVSEWVDGPSLQQLVDEEGVRGPVVVERVAVGMAVALAAVHRAGAVHHGLKPGNVLLGRDGPRMSDVGIAHAMEAVNVAFRGSMTEDPAYKSPEQLSGMGIGPAADVFAWASTVLFAATGKPPFGEGSPSEVMQRIVYDEADVSGVPDSLRETVAAALAKDPAERPMAKTILERLLGQGSALAGRLPASMVEEGRALATGVMIHHDVPPVVPPPRPPMAAPGGPMGAAAPPPGFTPGPAAPPGPLSGPPPGPPAGAPSGPPAGAPSGPFSGAPSGAPSGPPPESASPSLPLLGKLARSRRSRPEPVREPEPPAAELDPAAFEVTTAFNAIGLDRPERQTPAGGRDHAEQTTRFDALRPDPTATFDAVGPDPTATFDAVDLPAHPNPTEPNPLIPGLGQGRESHGHRSPANRSPLSLIAKMRRPGNHVLGLALSLAIGVGVGIAIIVLVLWPQLKSDDDSPSDSTNSSANRPVTTIPQSFAGTWTGTVVNTNRNASFPVQITFEAGGTTGRALYPRENCVGTLRLTRGTESALRMNLDIGKPCTSGIVQVTRQPDGTLQYTWTRPGTNLGYGGRLTKA